MGERVHSLGAIVCEAGGANPRLLLHFQERSSTEEIILAFLKGLKQTVDRPVVVLWDGPQAHWSRAVKRYVADAREWLTVERFPPGGSSNDDQGVPVSRSCFSSNYLA